MTTRHILRCLGEPALIAPTGRPVEFRTRKALGLLVFLAVEGRTHLREALAELLWTRAGSQESRHSLANAISEIRRRLGRTAVETAGDKVRVRGDVVELDLQRLLAGEVLGNEVRGPLDVDGFLEGFELPDAVGFAHWKESQRARLIPAVRDALVVLIDRARRTGDFAGLGRLGERLSRFDELSEDGIRARMESRAFAGDRLGALRLYEKWRTDLEGHLGAVPSALVEDMSTRLRRRSWERPGGTGSPSVRMDAWRGRCFVGRSEEYRRLYEAWEQTTKASPRHQLLVGDSGIGKSTLVERFAAVAALEGASVIRTQCHELERELPYVAVSDLIKQLIDQPGASATPPEQLAELGQHIPVVRKRYPALPHVQPIQGDGARVRFSEAMHALLLATVEERPVILIVDDIHNCDDVSLSVLNHVLRRISHHPLLCIFIARQGELRKSPNAARMTEQADAFGIDTVEIGPLSSTEATSILEGLLESAATTAGISERRALLGAAAGNPLVLELLVRDWRQSGDEALALELDAMTPGLGARRQARDTYRLVLDRLFSALDPETRTVLHTAAVLGPYLNDPAMYALADLTAIQVMHGLAGLTDLRLLRDSGAGLEFSNDVVRAQAYLSAPQSMRRMLHTRVAKELKRRMTNGEREHGLQLAWHYMRSGQTEDAVDHLLSAARHAINRGATHEAEFRLTSALRHLPAARRASSVLILCELLQEQGRWQESLTQLQTDAMACETLEGRARQQSAKAVLSQLLPSERAESAQLVSDIASCVPLDPATARAAAHLATNLYSDSNDVELARVLIGSVQSMEDRDWSSDERLDLTLARLKLQFGIGMTRHEREAALGVLEKLARDTNAWEISSVRSYSLISGIGVLNATLGLLEKAVEAHEHAFRLATRLDNMNRIANARANCIHLLGWLGSHGRQMQYAEELLFTSLVRHASPYAVVRAGAGYALSSLQSGRTEEVIRAIETVQGSLPALVSAEVVQDRLLFEADFLEILGDTREAAKRSWEALSAGGGLCLNPRLSAGGAARAASRLMRGRLDQAKAGGNVLSQLRGALDVIDITERAEALDAMLRTEDDPEERLRIDDRLRSDLELLPASATRYLTYFSSDSEPTTNLGRGH